MIVLEFIVNYDFVFQYCQENEYIELLVNFGLSPAFFLKTYVFKKRYLI